MPRHTDQLLVNAKRSAVLVVPSAYVVQVRRDARRLDRNDVEIVGPDWINNQEWRGRHIDDLIIDVDAEKYLKPHQVMGALTRIITDQTTKITK